MTSPKFDRETVLKIARCYARAAFNEIVREAEAQRGTPLKIFVKRMDGTVLTRTQVKALAPKKRKAVKKCKGGRL